MTISEFQDHPPVPGSINLLYSGSLITAVSISNVNCVGTNVAQSLKELQSVTVYIDSVPYILNITQIDSKDNYYSYIVVPTSIPDTSDKGCSDTSLNPQVQDIAFSKSSYQVLKNNVEQGTTIGYIFDVDRTTLSPNPVNFNNIISSSATLATFQDLLHESKGMSNSRYGGSKTTQESYGTISSISIGTFEGAIYNANVENSFICSQSLQERNVITLGLNSEYFKSGSSPDGQPAFSKITNQFLFDGYITGSAAATASLDKNQTELEFDWRQSAVNKLQQNALYHFTTETTEEFFILKSFEYISSKTVGGIPLNTYRVKVLRGASGIAYDHAATNTVNYKINIKKVEADQIFEFDGNKITTLSNRKIYLPLKNVVVRTGKEGMIFSTGSICT